VDYPEDDRILSILKWWHNTWPICDLRGVYVVIATILFLIGVWLIYRSFCPKTSKESTAQNRIWWRRSVFILGAVLVFFAVFNTRMVSKRCQVCSVDFRYTEARVFGILLNTYNYSTHYAPENIFETSYPSGITCHHCYITDASGKFWGGIIPSLEYELGMDTLAPPGWLKERVIIDDTYFLPKQDHTQENEQ